MNMTLRKWGLTALGLLLLGMTSSWQADAKQRLEGSVDTKLAYAQDSATTSVTLVPAQSGRVIRLYGLMLGVDTADDVSVKCGTTTKLSLSLGNNSGVMQRLYPLTVSCIDDTEALIIEKGTGTTDLKATAWYTQERN